MTTTPWGGEIRYRDSTQTTMDDAQALEDSGALDGSVAWAGHQTAGRGRRPDRRWVGEQGASLMFTVFWSPARFRAPEFAPSLVVGLGVCLWLESLGLSDQFPVRLKWPNDVYLGDQKLAGILVRRRLSSTRATSIHAGIGINLTPQLDRAGFATLPVSLSEAGVSVSPEKALLGLLPFLAQALEHLDPRSACAARLWRREQVLSLKNPSGEVVEGLVRDLDPTGALVWDRAGRRETLSSAE